MAPFRKFLYALPILVQVACIVCIEILLFTAFPQPLEPEDFLRIPVVDLLPLMMLLMVAVLATLVGLIADAIYVLSNAAFPQEKRTLWMILLLLTGSVGQVIFWFKFIRRAAVAGV